MKTWTLFICGKPYVVKADAIVCDDEWISFSIDGHPVGRFAWDSIDGYMEVK